MYWSPFNTERPYMGPSSGPDDHRCPICGYANSACPESAPAPMPHPPVDIDVDDAPTGGPLRNYTVTVDRYTTTMRLNEIDAVRYGGAAVLIV